MISTRRLLTITLLIPLGAAALTACSSDSRPGAADSSSNSPDTTAVVIAPSSTGTTSTTTTTLAATTTTIEPLPVPARAPAPHAPEPRVELGTIEIPKIGVSMMMFEGVSLTALDRGPGHWPGTAMPGHRGNVVVAGHRTSHTKPFRNIDKLAPGDEVIFTTPEGRYVYKVTMTEVVRPSALRIIDQTPASTATLFACHPPGSTRERLVVHLQLASV